MASKKLVVLSDGTKPLPEPISGVLWHSYRKYLNISILDMRSQVTNSRLQLHLPGANELN